MTETETVHTTPCRTCATTFHLNKSLAHHFLEFSLKCHQAFERWSDETTGIFSPAVDPNSKMEWQAETTTMIVDKGQDMERQRLSAPVVELGLGPGIGRGTGMGMGMGLGNQQFQFQFQPAIGSYLSAGVTPGRPVVMDSVEGQENMPMRMEEDGMHHHHQPGFGMGMGIYADLQGAPQLGGDPRMQFREPPSIYREPDEL